MKQSARNLYATRNRKQVKPASILKMTVDVRFGSFATELVKVDAGTCPLRSESDRNIAVPRMNAIAKSGPTTPASGCISCRGYQASDLPQQTRGRRGLQPEAGQNLHKESENRVEPTLAVERTKRTPKELEAAVRALTDLQPLRRGYGL